MVEPGNRTDVHASTRHHRVAAHAAPTSGHDEAWPSTVETHTRHYSNVRIVLFVILYKAECAISLSFSCLPSNDPCPLPHPPHGNRKSCSPILLERPISLSAPSTAITRYVQFVSGSPIPESDDQVVSAVTACRNANGLST